MSQIIIRALVVAALLPASLTVVRAEEEQPKAAPGIDQGQCVHENSTWTRDGRRIAFTVELTNQCGARFKCRVFAYVTSAKGTAQGRGTIALKPGAKGQESKGRWSMRVKMAGGSAQTARECRAL